MAGPANWHDGRLTWDRYALNLDAPAPAAIACFGDPSGKSIRDIAPGSTLELAVRGVYDESPWLSGPDGATDVRGWSVHFDGIPAVILGLDRNKVTVVVPTSLSAGPVPRETVMSYWYRGRREQYVNVWLAAAPSAK